MFCGLGEGDDGKLGHSSRLSCDKPRLIEALKSKRVRDIACGSSHSAAITSAGELYTWGSGMFLGFFSERVRRIVACITVSTVN
jgi:alpha-tubulin suppressor-like RCC1 family protein